jgi:hypothetical protein
MKAIIVLSMDFPEPGLIVVALEKIDPPSVPYFAGQVRIAIDHEAQRVIDWLDAPESNGDHS